MQIIPAQIVSTGHVVLTGPITGTVTLQDGTVVDVSAPGSPAIDQAQADEIAHLVGLRYAAEGHPDDIEVDDDPDSDTFGELIQRPFDYQPPDAFADYTPHADNFPTEG